MRDGSLLLWATGWTAAALIGACGSDVGVEASAGSTGAGGQGTMSTGSGTSAAGMGGAASSSAGQGGMDASADAPDGMFAPALFDCQGCLCDGKTHYCYIVHAGALPGPPPEPPCDDDGGASTGCLPLPPQCAAMPVCSCVNSMMGVCLCDELGGGVTVTCNLP